MLTSRSMPMQQHARSSNMRTSMCALRATPTMVHTSPTRPLPRPAREWVDYDPTPCGGSGGSGGSGAPFLTTDPPQRLSARLEAPLLRVAVHVVRHFAMAMSRPWPKVVRPAPLALLVWNTASAPSGHRFALASLTPLGMCVCVCVSVCEGVRSIILLTPPTMPCLGRG